MIKDDFIDDNKYVSFCRFKNSRFVNVVGFHIVEGFPLPNAMPTDDGNVYTFDVSSFDKISSTPMLRDPYEAICVACKKSKVSFGHYKFYYFFGSRWIP